MITSNKNWLNESADAFLAYCAFDVRWYSSGNNHLLKHDINPETEEEAEGERAAQVKDNQAIAESKSC